MKKVKLVALFALLIFGCNIIALMPGLFLDDKVFHRWDWQITMGTVFPCVGLLWMMRLASKKSTHQNHSSTDANEGKPWW